MTNSLNPLIELACNPQKSVVLEACAGSGKTWILISRIFRLLLSGVAPHEILAITFTRKAAQEMRERLETMLTEFANFDDATIVRELMLRGLTEVAAQQAIPRAKGLFEEVLSSPQKMAIDTFHGWFSQICQVAPLTSDLNIQGVMREDQARMMTEAMHGWWEKLGQGQGEFVKLQSDYISLLNDLSAYQLNDLIIGKSSLMQQMAMWVLFEKYCQRHQLSIDAILLAQFPMALEPDPSLQMADEIRFNWTGLQLACQIFTNGGDTDVKQSKLLEKILALRHSGAPMLEMAIDLNTFLFTAEKTPRANLTKISVAIKEYLSQTHQQHLEAELLECFALWMTEMQTYNHWQLEIRHYHIQLKWLGLARSAAEFYARYKKNHRVMDFNDLEFNAYQLMSSDATASYLQTRLDARYQHILIDEFQDTNPLQWQILKSWLDAYSAGLDKPHIFLVGDPKQSIYRFRRADARLFNYARDYLKENFQAEYYDHSQTRRNPPEIVTVVNQLFEQVKLEIPDYPFNSHTTVWKNLSDQPVQTEVFRLPLIPYLELPGENDLRDPFAESMPDQTIKINSMQSESEAEQIGQLILHWYQTATVISELDGIRKARKAQLGDFLILVRTRTHLQVIEKVLNRLNIPCDSPRKGGLLASLEAEDISALLKTLLMPTNNLTLGHVLRTPIFSFTEKDLELLAITSLQSGKNWWHSLQHVSQEKMVLAYQQLQKWLELAKFLPVHDLLDRIYHEGRVLEVYARSAPPLMRSKVLANLDAFLFLALDTNAGRYPSLSRFIEELGSLYRGHEQESPDEGEMQDIESFEVDDEMVNAAQADARFVRVMTIHGAKGLEAPFVFMMNTNTIKTKEDSCGVLFNWSIGQDYPHGLVTYAKDFKTDIVQTWLNAEEEIKNKEKWNLLYVGMTRAKQCLVISGLGKKSTKHQTNGLNINSWYERLLQAGLPEKSLEDLLCQTDLLKDGLNPVVEDGLPRSFAPEDLPLASLDVVFPAIPLIIPIKKKDQKVLGEPEILSSEVVRAKELGTAIHLILERHLDEVDTTKQSKELPDIAILKRWLNISDELLIDAYQASQAILRQPNLQCYFDPALLLEAWNELDLIDEDGQLFKVDRLVELENKLVILDYKLNIPDQGQELWMKYQKQIQKYQQLIHLLRPDKPIEAYLIDQMGKTCLMI